MEKVNWGILGLGNVAQKFSESFSEISNARLLAISSKNSDKLKKFERQFNIDKKYSFNHYDDLVNCKDVDIVYIALPNSFHYDWSLRCINNNKHVLVEKPIATNLKEIEDIKQNLSSKDLFFGEAFMYRYHPQIDLVINMINNNEIGNLLSMQSLFGKNLLTKKKFFFINKKKKIDPNNRIFNKKLGGGCILDLGCYPLSFSLLIGSLISKLNNKKIKLKNIIKKFNETGVDVDAYSEIIFENGFSSKIGSSFSIELGSRSEIIGETGKIIIDNTWLGSENILKINDKNQNQSIKIENKKNIYSYQIESISKNLANGIFRPQYPGMTMNESFLNMELIDEWFER